MLCLTPELIQNHTPFFRFLGVRAFVRPFIRGSLAINADMLLRCASGHALSVSVSQYKLEVKLPPYARCSMLRFVQRVTDCNIFSLELRWTPTRNVMSMHKYEPRSTLAEESFSSSLLVAVS